MRPAKKALTAKRKSNIGLSLFTHYGQVSMMNAVPFNIPTIPSSLLQYSYMY